MGLAGSIYFMFLFRNLPGQRLLEFLLDTVGIIPLLGWIFFSKYLLQAGWIYTASLVAASLWSFWWIYQGKQLFKKKLGRVDNFSEPSENFGRVKRRNQGIGVEEDP
jgi:hypothetical protein